MSRAPGTVDSATSERELIGARIGNLRIVELLGTGGMGAVYAAVDEKLERTVAVKAIRHDRRLDAEAKVRFLREARILSRLEHPHICQIFEYLEHGDLGHFLVLEMIHGETLETVSEGQLDRTQRLKIALQLADVLVAAHEQGVVHRDLKPGNVMVTDAGDVKVLDFGLSRLVDEQREATLTLASRAEAESGQLSAATHSDRADEVATQLGAILGTLSYMSPEQARGEAAGPASDMYSFGLVIQELFTGEPAYDPSDSLAHRLARARNAETRRVKGVDAELEALVNRLKALNPGARPSAQDTAERLRLVRDGPKRRVKKLVITAVIALLSVLSGGLAIQTARITTALDRAEAETAKATAINRFVQDALGSADPIRGVGREVTLLESLAGAVDRIDDSLGDQPDIAAAVRSTFGRTYVSLGRYEEADPLLCAALATRRQIHGDAHPDVASSLHDLGLLRLKQGELDEAERLLREALEVRRSLIGEKHPEVVMNLMDLGMVLESKDQYDKAELIARQALQLSRVVYGEHDPRVGDALNDLAWVLYREGESAEAEQLFRQALRLRRQGLGEDHPSVALTMSNLAVLLIDRDELTEAEALVLRCLELRRKTLGKDHPNVADSLHLLGLLSRRRGDLAQAETLLHQALTIKRNAVGEVHTEVATHLNQLASVLSDRGDLDRAEQYQRQALDVYRKLGDGARPVFLATALQDLAWILTGKGEQNEAERLYREALEILQEVYEPDHWMIANTRANLGACLTRLARYQEAEELLLSSHRCLVASLGEEHRRSQKATRFLTELYLAWDRPAKHTVGQTPSATAPGRGPEGGGQCIDPEIR